MPGVEEAGGRRCATTWAGLQSAAGSRVIETVLPETDDRAVRILTVQGAKGLEFPITVLSGMTSRLGGRPRSGPGRPPRRSGPRSETKSPRFWGQKAMQVLFPPGGAGLYVAPSRAAQGPRDIDLPPGRRADTAAPWGGPSTPCSRPSTWHQGKG